MTQPPKAFQEDDIQEKFWRQEPWDQNLPEEGFITDFILATRGVETPTKLSFWTAIWVISSALKRDTWLEWFPDPLYPNFFIFLVGPPKIVAKSTAVGFGEKILTHFHEYIPNEEVKVRKEVNMLRSKATPEAMSVVMAPVEKPIMKNGKVFKVDKGSQVAVAVSELSTFLGKQKYNEGLIDRLTHFYDCKDEDDEVTIGRGHNKFRNVYVTLIGATTPDHLVESIPEQAFGGGFMSRVVVAYQGHSTRDYPKPRKVIGGPSIEDLRERLAWVAENAEGEYYLEPDAYDFYAEWYPRFKNQLAKGTEDVKAKMKHRMDIHLLKLALILRAQRYTPGNNISLKEVKHALEILEHTYSDAQQSIENVGVSQYTGFLNRAREVIRKKGKVTRRQLLQALSPYGCSADLLTKLTDQMLEAREIRGKLNGKEIKHASRNSNEFYIWTGDKVNATKNES
jgi:hypothetical protein